MMILENRGEDISAAPLAEVSCLLLFCWVCEACLHSSIWQRKGASFSLPYRGVQWKTAQCSGKLALAQWKTHTGAVENCLQCSGKLIVTAKSTVTTIYQANLAASSRAPGSTRIEPSGKIIVG